MSDTELITNHESTQSSKAAVKTARKRQATWNQFESWCTSRRYRAVPPTATVVELYVREHTGKLAYLTLKTRVEHLRALCRAYDVPWPEDETVITVALRRAKEHGTHRSGTPLLERELTDLGRNLSSKGDDDSVQDWALIALGAAAGLDANELSAMRPCDVAFDDEGRAMHITFGERRPWLGDVVVAFKADARRCPAAALRRWLERRDDNIATLFLNADGTPMGAVDITRVVRTRLNQIGRTGSLYSWMSLRGARLAAHIRMTA